MNRELKKLTEEEVRECMDFTIADLKVTDPVLFDLFERAVRKEITFDEYLAAMSKHNQG